MSWRTVVISSNAKLDYQLGYMVVRKDVTTKIHLGEIGMLMVESTSVSITAALLSELVKHKIKVIFCDEKRNPISELIPYYGAHNSSAKIKKQMSWTDARKTTIWTEIVYEKIHKQAEFLQELRRKESELLYSYLNEITFGDTTNRQGHAAKVYFNALFGMDFTRSADTATNASLNYGYSLLLSAFNREVCANGYLTQLGIFHNNMFNHFNLSCDLMEPFRVLVDRIVYEMKPTEFGQEQKHEIWKMLDQRVEVDGQEQFVMNAIKIYTKSVLDAINDGDSSGIKFYSMS